MFCTKCGTQNEEGAQFCVRCGEPLAQRRVAGTDRRNSGAAGNEFYPNGGYAPAFPQRNRSKTIIAVIVIAVVIILAVFLLTGRSSDSVVEKYVEASFELDIETIWSLLPPEMREAMVEEAEDEMNLYGEEEVISYMEDELRDEMEYLMDQLGGNLDYTWEIIDEEEYDRSDLRELNQSLREMGLEDFTADDAKDVEVEIFVTSGGESGSYSATLTLIQQGRKWYLGNIGNISL